MAAYVDLVGDFRPGSVGTRKLIGTNAAGPDAQPVEQPDPTLERLARDGRLEHD